MNPAKHKSFADFLILSLFSAALFGFKLRERALWSPVEGVHRGNFSDWPLWDKVFGTYRAPVEEPIRVGFDRAGLAEQLKMLAFIDINAPTYINGGRIESTAGASSVFP